MPTSMLLAATIGIPLSAMLLASAFERFRAIAFRASVIASSACFVLSVSLAGHLPATYLPKSWLTISDALPLSMTFSQDVSATSAALVISLFASWLILRPAIEGTSKSRVESWLGLQIAVTLAATASDLAVILLSWLIIELLVEHLALGNHNTAGSSEIKLISPLRLSSLCLLASIGLLHSRYHTLDVAKLINATLHDDRVDANVTRNGLAIVLAAALVLRCGAFPISLWLKRLADSKSPAVLPLTGAIIIPAFALSWRLQSLWSSAPNSQLLFFTMGTVGCAPLALTAIVLRGSLAMPLLGLAVAAGVAHAVLDHAAGWLSLAVVSGAMIGLALLTRFKPLNSQSPIGSCWPGLLAPINDLGRSWWYVEAISDGCLAFPLRGAALLIEFVDRVVLCGTQEGAWSRPARQFADFMDSMRLGKPRHYALAILWAVAGLSVVVLLGR